MLSVIANLSSALKSKSDNKNIKHYLDKHGNVPLWVLVKYLTFGNLNYMYKCYDSKLRNVISQDFAKGYKHQYAENIHITPEMLESIFKCANFYRNICAHEEILYNFRLKKKIKTAAITKALNINIHSVEGDELYTMVVVLKLVLTKSEYEAFVLKIENILNTYSQKLSAVSFQDIMEIIGFPKNWKEQLIQ